MNCILPLQRGFIGILEKHRKPGECILNFRSPDYSPESGYRPVEIRLVGDTGSETSQLTIGQASTR